MKKIYIYLFLVICLGTLTSVSCRKDKSKLELTEGTTRFISVDHNSTNMGIKFWSATNWKAKLTQISHAGWTNMTKTSGRGGDNTISLTIYKNQTSEIRTATLIITSGDKHLSINIKQAELMDGITLNDPSDTNLDAPSTVYAKKVGFRTAEPWEVIVSGTSDISWCTITEKIGETTGGFSSFVINATENKSSKERSATIIIDSGWKEETITVIQTVEGTVMIINGISATPSSGTASKVEVDVANSITDLQIKITNSTGDKTWTATAQADDPSYSTYDELVFDASGTASSSEGTLAITTPRQVSMENLSDNKKIVKKTVRYTCEELAQHIDVVFTQKITRGVMINAKSDPRDDDNWIIVADRNCGATNNSVGGNPNDGSNGAYYKWTNGSNDPNNIDGAYNSCKNFVDANGNGEWGLPTLYEWRAIAGIDNDGNKTNTKLKWNNTSWSLKDERTENNAVVIFPLAGRYYFSSGLMDYQGTQAYYWSSAGRGDSDYGWILHLNSNGNTDVNTSDTSNGYSVRCVKDIE